MYNKFLDYFRINKPHALQWHEWNEWESITRANKPIAYWLNETVPDFFRAYITHPFNDLRYAIRMRLFDRYHIISTGLKPGYADCDTRMLHGMFTLLVDFVEIEKAWMHVVFDKTARDKYKFPWWSIGWTRIKSFRNPEAGVEHLHWEMTLNDPNLGINERCDSQAEVAKEILELYHWWKEIRPNRPDPYDASGWTEYCNTLDTNGIDILRDKTDEESNRCKSMLDLTRKIEEEQHKEDEEMLIRLVKIRRNMWT